MGSEAVQARPNKEILIAIDMLCWLEVGCHGHPESAADRPAAGQGMLPVAARSRPAAPPVASAAGLGHVL